MIVKGLIVDPIANMPVVILRDAEEKSFLPIWIGVYEASAIALQLEGVTTPRPMTHDLLRNVLEKLGAEVVRVTVTDLVDNTFLAIILLRLDGREILLDSRPSDAIALALRAGAPLFVEESVLEKSQASSEKEDAQNAERLRKWLEEVDPDTLSKYRM
jgi:bifunctional DNase/RNase